MKPKTKKNPDGLTLKHDEMKALKTNDGITVLAWKSKREWSTISQISTTFLFENIKL